MQIKGGQRFWEHLSLLPPFCHFCPQVQHKRHFSASATQSYDTVIIGAGIMGLNIAYQLKRRNPDHSVLLLESTSQLGNGFLRLFTSVTPCNPLPNQALITITGDLSRWRPLLSVGGGNSVYDFCLVSGAVQYVIMLAATLPSWKAGVMPQTGVTPCGHASVDGTPTPQWGR